ncbi:MAG: hypothetical protein ABL879_07555 [Devosia sp.]
MAEKARVNTIAAALAAELAAQGQGRSARLDAYPVHGSIDVLALAEAAEKTLVAGEADGDAETGAKTPAELSAANDG